MASESCPICGDEADADELDPHGHFDTDDAQPMTKFTGDPDEAEADLHRASQAVQRAEEELALAEERRDEIYDEQLDGSPKAEADWSERMEAVEREITSLQAVVADAGADFSGTVSRWEDEGFLS